MQRKIIFFLGLSAFLPGTPPLLAQGVAQGVMQAAPTLQQRAEAFAGAPVALDTRIALPPCLAQAPLRWHEPGRSIEARCDNFSMVLPVMGVTRASAAQQPVVVKRGDPVLVSAMGEGYRVVLEGRAEANGRAGERIMVRNSKSGQRILAEVGRDGALSLASAARPIG